MNASVLLLKAVQNNIDWCNVIAQSHSLNTVQLGGLWYCTEPMPPFYPNVITAAADALDPSVINDLLGQLEKPWFIKDSFVNHTAKMSYQSVFDAHWYGYKSSTRSPESSEFEPLNHAENTADLQQWIAAWGETPEGKTIFLESLLSVDTVKFVSLKDHQEISCGAALCFSQDVIGITNLFGSIEEQQRLIRTIQLSFPEMDIVGYGDESELTLLKPFGFQELGTLSVLINSDE